MSGYCRCSELPGGQAAVDSCPYLVSGYLSGDLDAGEALFQRMTEVVRTVLQQKLGATRIADCEDLAQEAMMRLLRNLSNWRGECRLCYYAATVATRVAIDHARGKRIDQLLDGSGDPGEPASEDRHDPLLLRELAGIVAGFPEKWQELIRLRLDEVPMARCAEILGVSRGTCHNWLNQMQSRMEKSHTEWNQQNGPKRRT